MWKDASKANDEAFGIEAVGRRSTYWCNLAMLELLACEELDVELRYLFRIGVEPLILHLR